MLGKFFIPTFYKVNLNLFIYFDQNGEYLKGIEWKRNIHQQFGTKLIETFSYERQEGTLISNLREKLLNAGCEFEPLSKNIMFNRLEELGSIENFVKLLGEFLNLRKSNKRLNPFSKNGLPEMRIMIRQLCVLNLRELKMEMKSRKLTISLTTMISESSNAASYLGKTWYSVIARPTDIEDGKSPHLKGKSNILYVDGHVEKKLKVQLQFNNYQIFMNTQP